MSADSFICHLSGLRAAKNEIVPGPEHVDYHHNPEYRAGEKEVAHSTGQGSQ